LLHFHHPVSVEGVQHQQHLIPPQPFLWLTSHTGAWLYIPHPPFPELCLCLVHTGHPVPVEGVQHQQCISQLSGTQPSNIIC
jgi:hypothetical protein